MAKRTKVAFNNNGYITFLANRKDKTMTDKPPFSSQCWGYKNITLSTTKHRMRYGCDYCKKREVATEGFIGFNGNVLWICGKCFKKLSEWKQ